MIAVDTNVLVHAHRDDSPHYQAALKAVSSLRQNAAAWAIPWPCVHEFISIVTHPKIFKTPTPLEMALNAVVAWQAGNTLHFLSESAGYWEKLAGLVRAARICGPRIHDARIAALCLHHGISELWTADRDFSSFPQLKTRNPLVRS
jgi:uncharacterized protein